MRAHECDACGHPSAASGLRLCPECEVAEAEVGGDVARILAHRGLA